MNKSDNFIEKLGVLQRSLNNICTKDKNVDKEKKINLGKSKQIKNKKQKKLKIEEKFRIYLLERKLMGEIDDIMVKKFFIAWRKQLGRIILLREAKTEKCEQEKTKNAKASKIKKGKGKKIAKNKKNVQKKTTNDELIKYASKLIKKKEKECEVNEEQSYNYSQSDEIVSNSSKSTEIPDEESALQSENLHSIKNPFIIKNSINVTDSNKESEIKLESAAEYNEEEEKMSENEVLSETEKEEEERNSKVNVSPKISSFNMDKTVVFHLNEAPVKKLDLCVKEDVTSIPPTDEFSNSPKQLIDIFSSDSYTSPAVKPKTEPIKLSNSKKENNSTTKLMKKVRRAMRAETEIDIFDSLVEQAQSLLQESNEPIDSIINSPLYDPSDLDEVIEKSPEESKNHTKIQSTPESKNASKLLEQPTPKSNKIESPTLVEKEEKIIQTKANKVQKASPALPLLNKDEEEDYSDDDDFERRLSELAASTNGALVIDDEGDVIDVDDYIKSMGVDLNELQHLNVSDEVDDSYVKNYELDHELATLKRTFGNTISNMSSNIFSDSD